MRLATFATLLLGALVVTAQTADTNTTDLLQELAQLPNCATLCIATYLLDSTCDTTDLACLCADETYIDNSATCILSNCTVRGALASETWQKKACNAPVRDNGPLSRRLGDAFLVIGGICVGARFLAGWRFRGTGIGWDDWTILVAYLMLIPSTVIVQLMTFQGMGQDIWAVPFDNITVMLKYFYFEQYIYQCIIVLTKISIVLLYLRIFPKEVSSKFQHASYAVIVGLTIYGIGFIIYFGFQCRPINYFWNQWTGEQEGHCINQQFAIYIHSAINITFDLIVFFLPIPKLLKLQVRSTRRKIGVILTFLVGLFVTVCSMVRLSTLANIGKITNLTYDYNSISLWSALEGDVGVICACMPSLAGPMLYFFRDVLKVKISSFTHSAAGKSTGTSGARITGNRSIARLPSSASERVAPQDDGHQLDPADKTVVASIYNMPYGHRSGDDVELIEQPPPHGRREKWGE